MEVETNPNEPDGQMVYKERSSAIDQVSFLFCLLLIVLFFSI